MADEMTADLSDRTRLLVRIGGGLLLAGFIVYLLHVTVGLGSGGGEGLFGTWLYDGLMLGAAVSCLLRALVVGRERVGWALLGAGLVAYAAGEIYYSAAITGSGELPIPSPADIGYLAFYPLAYAGLIALVRGQLGSFPAVRWLDGLIAAGAVAALTTALALGPIVAASSSGDVAAAATNLAYPIADLALLSLIITVAALSGWRPGLSWLTLGLGLIVLAGSDVVYLLQAAQGTYVEDGLLDAAWPLGVLLLAAAAWLAPAVRRGAGEVGLRVALVPALAALAAIGVLFAERYLAVPTGAAVLALATLLGVVARMALSFRETQLSLRESVHESLTDPLTELANRRSLMEDLGAMAARAPAPGTVGLLVMFDLDGFKAYNDAFGHPAGDALLTRLGSRLQAFTAGRGDAYRLGGDEFCLLCECTAAEVDALVAGGAAALSERGDGFLITAAQGSVLLPGEASTSDAALTLADRRMYANKSGERASAGSQSRDVLLSALRERRPELHEHLLSVAGLALRVAEARALGSEQRDEIFRAAELHDVGKVAIPDAILNKPGPLEAAEWEFMRKHTLIGERIIAAAPALVPVARLVRSTHERWDGAGYPDGLRGEQIPLGSRIISVCDAYEAMVTERPYSVAMMPARAMEELQQGAGSQFDPAVVATFVRVPTDRDRRPPVPAD